MEQRVGNAEGWCGTDRVLPRRVRIRTEESDGVSLVQSNAGAAGSSTDGGYVFPNLPGEHVHFVTQWLSNNHVSPDIAGVVYLLSQSQQAQLMRLGINLREFADVDRIVLDGIIHVTHVPPEVIRDAELETRLGGEAESQTRNDDVSSPTCGAPLHWTSTCAPQAKRRKKAEMSATLQAVLDWMGGDRIHRRRHQMLPDSDQVSFMQASFSILHKDGVVDDWRFEIPTYDYVTGEVERLFGTDEETRDKVLQLGNRDLKIRSEARALGELVDQCILTGKLSVNGPVIVRTIVPGLEESDCVLKELTLIILQRIRRGAQSAHSSTESRTLSRGFEFGDMCVSDGGPHHGGCGCDDS